MWIDDYNGRRMHDDYSWRVWDAGNDRYYCFERWEGLTKARIRATVTIAVHGKDAARDYHPISKYCIRDSETLLEHYWEDLSIPEANNMWNKIYDTPEIFTVRAALN